MILCAGLAFLEPYAVHVLGASPLCADFSTGGALLVLFLLVFLVNGAWRLLHRGSLFNSGELSLVYIMLITACAVISWGFVLNLLPLLAGLQYYADPANRWAETILTRIPGCLLPQGEEAVRGFYEGLPAHTPIPYQAWLVPLFIWTTIILAVYFLMLAVYTLFRKPWIEDEKLLFPLVQLPLALTEEPPAGALLPPIMRNPLFWTGAAVPFVFYSLKALHNYFPLVPQVSLASQIPIMRHGASLNIRVFFEAIGLSFLLTTNLSLSIWVFTLCAAFLTGYCNMVGYSTGGIEPVSDPSIPLVAHQAEGALLAFVIYLIWRSRKHILGVFLKAIGRKPDMDDSEELFSYRTTVFGSIVAFIYLVFWLNRMGVNLTGSVAYLLIAYIIFIGLTRAVTQGGVAYGRPPVAPFFSTVDLLGSNALGAGGIVGLGLQSSWSADTRTFVMASAANGTKIAAERKIHARRMLIAIGAAILVAIIGTYISGLLIAYRIGGLNTAAWHYRGVPQCWGGLMKDQIVFPAGPRKLFMAADLLGAGLMAGFIFMQNRFLWWPFHPLGLAIGSTSPSQWVWFSIFLGWLSKVLIIRVGGVAPYRKAMPLFLGLILGGFVAAGLWILIDACTGMTGNRFTLG